MGSKRITTRVQCWVCWHKNNTSAALLLFSTAFTAGREFLKSTTITAYVSSFSGLPKNRQGILQWPRATKKVSVISYVEETTAKIPTEEDLMSKKTHMGYLCSDSQVPGCVKPSSMKVYVSLWSTGDSKGLKNRSMYPKADVKTRHVAPR